MKIVDEILEAAKAAPRKEPLTDHLKTIITLREKDYSWRDIAEFLNKHGILTNHSKIFRFYQKNKGVSMITIPNRTQYAKALKDISINENQKKMLAYHFKAHNRTVTFTELAEAVGFDNYNSANLHYGTLGRKIGEELNFSFATDDKREEPFYSSSIGAGNPYQTKDQEFQFVMHHELAEAIRELGWFS